MNKTLILNPHAVLFRDPKIPETWIIQAPKPERGLQWLRVDQGTHNNLYDLFEELGDGNLNLIEIENDLDETERKLLFELGILIENGTEFEKPLYSCLLDATEPTAFDKNAELIVDPTFVFEPFDLNKFRNWIQEKNLSPYNPTAWITNSFTGMRSGYWLNADQSAVVSTFEPDLAISTDVDLALIEMLFGAGILTTRERLENERRMMTATLSNSSNEFERDGFAVVQKVIGRSQINAMAAFYREFQRLGFMKFGEELVPLRFAAPLEPLAGTIHRDLTTLMSSIVGESVKPSYCYVGSYVSGASLIPHVDRPQCEFSFSLQMDYDPMPETEISPWPLYLTTKSGATPIHLGNGDCLAYKGCEIEHFRDVLPDGHRSVSLFLHYVPLDFDGPLA